LDIIWWERHADKYDTKNIILNNFECVYDIKLFQITLQ